MALRTLLSYYKLAKNITGARRKRDKTKTSARKQKQGERRVSCSTKLRPIHLLRTWSPSSSRGLLPPFLFVLPLRRPYLTKALPRPPLICSGYRCKFLEQRDIFGSPKLPRRLVFVRQGSPATFESAFGNCEVSWIRTQRGEARGTDGG